MSQRLKKHLVVLVLYAVLTLLMTMPVALNLTTHIAGSGGDPWQTLWRFENLQEKAISTWEQGTTAVFMTEQFFGGGEPRLVNNSAWPWMPLHLLFGQPLAYNIIWLLSFILSGYFMFLLMSWLLVKHGKSVVSSQWSVVQAAWLSGLLYMFLPYHVAHAMGHFGAMQTQWLPLVILLTCMFLEKQTIWRALGLAAAITIQSWTEHHYMLWYSLFVLLLLVFHWKHLGNFLRQIPNPKSQIPITVLTFCALVFGFSILPWWPTIRQAFSQGEALSLGYEQTIRFSTDIFAFFVPAIFQPIWGAPLAMLFTDNFTGNISEATQYLGVIPLLLVIFFSQKIPKQQRNFWLVVGGLFILIALGPRLHVLGRVTALPLPYTLIDSLPGFSAIRAVGRAGAMIGLSFSVLFGWVVATQVKRLRFVLIIAALILVEFLFVSVPLQSANLSDAYDELAGLPGETVIEIPAATNYNAASRALYASTIHNKKVLGSIALERGELRDDLANGRALPGLRQLLYVRSKHLQEGKQEFHNQDLVESFADTAKYVGAGAVLVHKDSLSPIQLLAVRNFLEEQVGVAVQEYSDVLLYELPESFINSGDGKFSLVDGQEIFVNP